MYSYKPGLIKHFKKKAALLSIRKETIKIMLFKEREHVEQKNESKNRGDEK
jgi:hypothetical protein